MSNNVMPEFACDAFGGLSVSQARPVVQILAQYGIRDSELSRFSIGGTSSSADSNFIISTGTGANNVSVLKSRRNANYRAGQGLKATYTALFTTGVADSMQKAGLLSAEASLAFGYNGAEYGILHARDGALENQTLLLTVGATASENATIVIGGVSHTVPLTAGTPAHNAYEIFAYLSGQTNDYFFSSYDDSVSVLANLTAFTSSTFTFSSGTAVGAFTQVTAATASVETWVAKADWNVNPNFNIDPTLGNVYQIQMQYLGYGGIFFSIENSDTGKFELVHIIKYANTATRPTVMNPNFKIGWKASNSGNTTDIVIKGASASMFVEGQLFLSGDKRGYSQTQAGVGTTETSIVSIKNRLTFNDITNRSAVLLLGAVFTTDTSKTAVFTLYANPVVATGESLEFVPLSGEDLIEISDDAVEITGGQKLAVFNIKSSSAFKADVINILSAIQPNDILTIAAHVTSGAGSEMDVALAWLDEL